MSAHETSPGSQFRVQRSCTPYPRQFSERPMWPRDKRANLPVCARTFAGERAKSPRKITFSCSRLDQDLPICATRQLTVLRAKTRYPPGEYRGCAMRPCVFDNRRWWIEDRGSGDQLPCAAKLQHPTRRMLMAGFPACQNDKNNAEIRARRPQNAP